MGGRFRRRKGNKFNATKTEVNGRWFASKKEAERFVSLCEALAEGQITNLVCQVPYELVPHIRRPSDGKYNLAVTYISDFEYDLPDGTHIVEDVKGYRDPSSASYKVFVIKKKLMLWRFGIEVLEV